MPPFVASTIRSRNAGRRGEHLAEQLLDLAEPGAAPVEAVDVGRVDEVHARRRARPRRSAWAAAESSVV